MLLIMYSIYSFHLLINAINQYEKNTNHNQNNCSGQIEQWHRLVLFYFTLFCIFKTQEVKSSHKTKTQFH